MAFPLIPEVGDDNALALGEKGIHLFAQCGSALIGENYDRSLRSAADEFDGGDGPVGVALDLPLNDAGFSLLFNGDSFGLQLVIAEANDFTKGGSFLFLPGGECSGILGDLRIDRETAD